MTQHKAAPPTPRTPPASSSAPAGDNRRQAHQDERRRKRAAEERTRRIADLEGRIAVREREVKEVEAEIAAPGFYDERARAETVLKRHQTLMWEVGDLMHQWEALQGSDTAD